MFFFFETEAPPIREDASGALRVGDTRVLLELVIRAFQDGATAEAIVQRYPTLTLSDTYTVIAYYLRHQTQVDEYLDRRERLAHEIRQRIDGQQGEMDEIRARLRARRRVGEQAMLRLLSDENFNGDVVRGLLLRQPRLDLVRVQDVGLTGRDDPDVLAWAAETGRILLTHDRATMPNYAFDRVTAGGPMPGVFVLNDRIPPRQAIEEILLINECSAQQEWDGHVVYLPL